MVKIPQTGDGRRFRHPASHSDTDNPKQFLNQLIAIVKAAVTRRVADGCD